MTIWAITTYTTYMFKYFTFLGAKFVKVWLHFGAWQNMLISEYI